MGKVKKAIKRLFVNIILPNIVLLVAFEFMKVTLNIDKSLWVILVWLIIIIGIIVKQISEIKEDIEIIIGTIMNYIEAIINKIHKIIKMAKQDKIYNPNQQHLKTSQNN